MNKGRFTQAQLDEIREMLEKAKNARLYRKLEVIFYAAQGWTNAAIAEATRYSRSRVSDLVSEYATNGIGYFTEEHRKGGNNRNLRPEDERAVLEEFQEKAENGQIIMIDEIKKKYDEKCGKQAGLSTFYRFLQRNEWRRVMPRGQHPKKADEEAIDASKKLTI